MSYYDVDFDRHPMPRSVVARIRERLAGKSGDAAAGIVRAHVSGATIPEDQHVGQAGAGYVLGCPRAPQKSASDEGRPHLRCSRDKE